MKKLIIVIILSTLSFSKDWFEGHQNPNGKPFTLTFGMNWEQVEKTRYLNGQEDNYTKDDARIDITLPIHSLLTLNYSYFMDRGYTLNNPSDYSAWVRSIGGELHLPIYKLWEK